ncbi:MAG: T9SS type A sorting domain-containing protein [Flavobacteriaceae bacterium]|nr:T9SS type A sorting domain-containing protein [Flavobacteriaceae bacterium]
MKKITFLFVLILHLHISFAQNTKRVLFLGNSYTAYNNLPNLVSQMATNTGDTLIYDSNTPGGFRLMNHASNTTTLNKINADNWDFVTLQAQSQETSWSEAQMQIEVYPFATELVNVIRQNNTCSQPLFYMTWGRENGDAQNCEFAPWVCTYEGMDDAIRNTYTFMAQENTTEVAPVGAVWRYLRTHHPEVDLYTTDGSHPSVAGSYAAACAFYTMIYKKDPSLITWNASLDNNIANTIRLAAKTIVFDEVNAWDFTANFNFTITNNEVTFSNTYAADTVLWDFNDGYTSSENNPVHVYNTIGDFEVTLSITACGRTHEITKTVSISNLSINNNTLSAIKIYPNPARDYIIIQGKTNENASASLYTIFGQKVKHFETISAYPLSINNIASGTYILKISSGNSSHTTKLLKL